MSEIDIFVSSIGNFIIISLDHVMKSKNKAFIITFVSADEDAEVLKEMQERFAARGKAVSVTGRMQHPGPQPSCVFSLPGLETTFCDPAYTVTENLPVYHDTDLAALSKIVRDAKGKRCFLRL